MPERQPTQDVSVRTVDSLNPQSPISKDRALEEMTGYVVMRLEEPPEDDDEPNWSPGPWVRVACSQVPGLSKSAISGEILKLDEETGSVDEKKATLMWTQLRHVEIVLEEQKRRFDTSVYETSLVQLDSRPKIPEKLTAPRLYREPSTRTTRRYLFSPKLRSERRGNGHKAPQSSGSKSSPECQSITAYFKISPRPEIDPVQLYAKTPVAPELIRRGVLPPPPTKSPWKQSS
jgi:hypothetical protein